MSRRKERAKDTEIEIERVVNSKAMSSYMSGRQLEMLKENPAYLFDAKVAQYQFVGFKDEDISEERLQEMEDDLIRGGKEWRNATL